MVAGLAHRIHRLLRFCASASVKLCIALTMIAMNRFNMVNVAIRMKTTSCRQWFRDNYFYRLKWYNSQVPDRSGTDGQDDF
jgi:hypothetical protein